MNDESLLQQYLAKKKQLDLTPLQGGMGGMEERPPISAYNQSRFSGGGGQPPLWQGPLQEMGPAAPQGGEPTAIGPPGIEAPRYLSGSPREELGQYAMPELIPPQPTKPEPFQVAGTQAMEERRRSKIERLEMMKNIGQYGGQLGASLAALRGHQSPKAFMQPDTSGIDQEIQKQEDIIGPSERSLIKEAFGIDIPEGATSWTHFAKIAPAIAEIARVKSQGMQQDKNRASQEKVGELNRASREDIAGLSAENRQAGLNMRQESLDLRKERMNRLSDADTKVLDKWNTADALLGEIIADKPKYSTGPAKDVTQRGLHVIGMDNPEFAGFRVKVQTELVGALHDLAGTAQSKAEAGRIMPTLPSTYDSDEVFMQKAKTAQGLIKAAKERFLNTRGAIGKNVGEIGGTTPAPNGMKAAPAPQGDTVDVIWPSTGAVRTVRRDALEEIQRRGYQLK